MNKKSMTAAKTIGAVMAVGGAAAMIGSAMMSTNSTKKQMSEKQLGNLPDNEDEDDDE